MQDRQLYQQILGITSPWKVERVELGLEKGEVRVYLAHEAGTQWSCPECGAACPLHDHQDERVWRHLDTCQYQTLLHASLPRTKCSEHGVKVVRVSWAEPHSRFTALFERLVIEWLKEASQSAVAERIGLSWEEVHRIMERAVRRGLARRQVQEVAYVGIDEKAYRKGHRYVTIVNDLDSGHVLYVAAEREQASLDGFWKILTQEQLSNIKGVALDMWEPYINSIEAHLPEAEGKMVFDKFHVAKHLGEAVDKVRRRENKELSATGDDRLVGTKYDWLRHPSNFRESAWRAFKALRTSKLRTARAWALKEQAMILWDYRSAAAARRHFRWWYRWATHSRLEPMKKAAKMLNTRLENILTYQQHRITNAMSESVNSMIQWIKYTARGYRNFDNFVNAIYFHCGGLDLAPAATQ
jgi:transposase